MPVVISPSSELARELRKWEQHHTKLSITEEGDSQPGNPYVYRPYPRMLYRAQKRTNGQYAVMEGAPSPYLFATAEQYERACFEVEQFNKSNQLIVQSEAEEQKARAQGWRNSRDEALAYVEALEQDMANAAAEAHFAASRMSDSAQREWQAAQDATHEHVVDVQGPKRGRKRIVTGTGPVED